MSEIMEKLKKIALENYTKGGDTFVECYDDEDWEEHIESAEKRGETPEAFLYHMMEIHEERQG